MKSIRNSRFIFSTLLIALSVFALANCGSINDLNIELPAFLHTPTPQLAGGMNTPTPTTESETESSDGTATPVPPQTITIWIPPELDPENEDTSGNIFQAQLEDFAAEQNNLQINLRVKASSGSGGMLSSLNHTQAAAPAALPALVILKRGDLEKAAEKGLIYPVEHFSQIVEDEDWYEYARELAVVGDLAYGLPLSGDTHFMVYRQNVIENPEENWEVMFDYGHPILFPAAAPESWLTLHLYLSAGGSLTTEENLPMLDQDILENVLNFYMLGAQHNAFPYWLTQYDDDNEIWQAYTDQQSHWQVAWSSDYLAKLPTDSSVIPLPPMTADAQSFALMDGLVLAVSAPDAAQQELAVQLAEHLTTSSYLSRWSFTAGFLPTRPSVMEAWPNQSMRAIMEQSAQNAHILPSHKILDKINPLLSDAAFQVIKLQLSPETAAQEAIDKFNTQQYP